MTNDNDEYNQEIDSDKSINNDENSDNGPGCLPAILILMFIMGFFGLIRYLSSNNYNVYFLLANIYLFIYPILHISYNAYPEKFNPFIKKSGKFVISFIEKMYSIFSPLVQFLKFSFIFIFSIIIEIANFIFSLLKRINFSTESQHEVITNQYKNDTTNLHDSDGAKTSYTKVHLHLFGSILAIFIAFSIFVKIDYIYRYDYLDSNLLERQFISLLIGSVSSSFIFVKILAIIYDLLLMKDLFLGRGHSVRKIIIYISLLTIFVSFVEPFINPDIESYLFGEFIAFATFLKGFPLFFGVIWYYFVVYIFSFALRR